MALDVSPEALSKRLAVAGKALLATHCRPDGDAVGSLLGLAGWLRGCGCEVLAFCKDEIPSSLAFLAGADAVVHEWPRGFRPDATVVMDCGDPRLLGVPLPEHTGPLVNLDHHETNLRYGDLNCVDPRASASGEMVYRVVSAGGGRGTREPGMSLEVAECIYAALVSDTGSFRYASTCPRVLGVAAELLERGVDPWRVASAIYENNPLSRISLLTMALRTLHVSGCGRYASITVTRGMFVRSGAEAGAEDGFINYTRSIRGVEVGIMFQELARGRYRVEFRSRGRVNVAALGRSLDGGGHRNAAGCEMRGSLARVRSRIYDSVARCIAEAP